MNSCLYNTQYGVLVKGVYDNLYFATCSCITGELKGK